jgi:hypothetical protein
MIVLLHVPNRGRTASDDPDTTTGLFSEKPSEAQKSASLVGVACRSTSLICTSALARKSESIFAERDA